MRPLEGAEDLGTTGEDSGTGGRQTKVLMYIFQGGSAGGDFIRVGDVVTNPPHGTFRGITGRQPKLREEGGWEYPPMETAMEEADL